MSGIPQNIPQGSAYTNPAYGNQSSIPQYPPQYPPNNIQAINTKDPLPQPNPHSNPPSRSLKQLANITDPNMITHKNDRKNFIAKVYSILACQLAFTSIVLGVVAGDEEVREAIQELFWVFIACWIASILLMISIVCSRSVSRKYPTNYIALFIFTLLETFILAYFCSYYSPAAVLSAGVMTFGVTTALTIYAFKTKKDFTTIGGILVVAITSLILFGVMLIFFWSEWVYTLYALIAVFLFGLFIVYDTQIIAGGRYQELTYDDFVIGALLLYVDIVGLFMYLLSLIGMRGQ